MRGTIDKLAKQHNTNKTPSPSHQRGSHNQPDINESFPSPPHGSKVFIALVVIIFFGKTNFGCYAF